jgi:hypothetical protein
MDPSALARFAITVIKQPISRWTGTGCQCSRPSDVTRTQFFLLLNLAPNFTGFLHAHLLRLSPSGLSPASL